MKHLIAIVSLSLLLVVSTAFAADNGETANSGSDKQPKRDRAAMAVVVGLYNPVSAEIRDLFGDSSLRIGLRPLPIDLKPEWVPAFDLGFYSMTNSSDEALLIPVTAGFIRSLNDEKHKTRAFLAVNAGPFYGNVDAPSIGRGESGVGLNANATVGMIMNNSWSIEARYDYFSEFAGLDFSALTVSASVKFTTIKF